MDMKLLFNPIGKYLDSCKRCDETPYDVLFKDGIVELRAYKPAAGEGGQGQPVLLVLPLAVNQSLYDYHPDHSALRVLQEQGLDVYLLSWGDTGYRQ